MRRLSVFAAAVVCVGLTCGEAAAQFRSLQPVPGGFVFRGPRTSGVLIPSALLNRQAFFSPLVGTPFVNTNVFVNPLGVSTFSNFGRTVVPFYAGPYHTIYFDAIANTYRYTSGYLNTPTVNLNVYANPYLTNPYLTNPYLYGNPYLANPYLFP